ncbi:hypothetical protein PTKIN_Ptkin07bG0040700 [Pterospermum kingtungense]
MTCSLCGQNGYNRRGCLDRTVYINAEAFDDVRANREAKAKGKEPVVDNMPKDKAKPKDKGKEKVIQTKRRSSGSKGILMQEPTVNMKGTSKGKMMVELSEDEIDSAIKNKKMK